jgi:hypothetical protein
MEIRHKRDFYALWRAGLIGNYIRTWETIDEALASGVPEIGFREVSRGGGWWERVPRAQAKETAEKWTLAGKRFLLDEGVPNHKTTMQGELTRTHEGLCGFIAVALRQAGGRYGLPPMRISMAGGMHEQMSYARTRALMGVYMDASSRDNIDDLLELYPDAAIEFTCFSVNVGVMRRNTLIWEVRNY